MRDFNIEQIDEDTLRVSIAADAPMSVVSELVKSLEAKGLKEDLAKSTASVRVFSRKPISVADQLIKSLRTLIKQNNDYPYSPKNLIRLQRQQREQEKEAKRKKFEEERSRRSGVNISPTPAPNQSPGQPDGPDVWPRGESWQQNPPKPTTGAVNTVKKSNYGPNNAGQYTPADNVERKQNNVGDVVEGIGPNRNVKAYSTRPGRLSAKQAANAEAKKYKRLNRKQPVKVFSPEEIAAHQAAQKDKLAASVDSYDQHEPLSKEENRAVNNLVALMHQKSMLRSLQPSSEDMIAAGQRMGIGVAPDQIGRADSTWNNTINSWLTEATKPISSRFSSEQEEIEYWRSIKVAGGDESDSGY